MVILAIVAFVAAAGAYLYLLLRKKRHEGLILLLPMLILIIVMAFVKVSLLVALLVMGAALLCFAAVMTRGTRRSPMFRRALVAFCLLMCGLFIMSHFAVNPAARPTGPTAPAAAPKLSDDAIKALTVTEEMANGETGINCSDKNFKYDIPSLQKFKKSGRANREAISTPIKEIADSTETTKIDIVKTAHQLVSKICWDPLLGASIVTFLLQQDPRLVKANSWMKPFVDLKSGTIKPANVVASYYIKHQNDSTLNSNQEAEKKKLEAEWRDVAGNINTLLNRAAGVEVRNMTPVSGFHLDGTGAPASSLPAVGVDDTLESGRTLLFIFPKPDKTSCVFALGFAMKTSNVGRFACT